MSKDIRFNAEAREKLKKGIDVLADAVQQTLGPQGKNVTIARSFGLPQTTKDGVTVAREVELEDPVMNMGIQMVKTVAQRTNDLAGDGTTTATVLARAIIHNGGKAIAAGARQNDIRKGIEKGTAKILENLSNLTIEVEPTKESLSKVASISANNDEKIGAIIGEAYEKVGKEGVITVEDSNTGETYSDLVEGFQFDQGMISPYFMTNPNRLSCEFEDALVLIYNGKISNASSMKKALEFLVQAQRPILIIADEVSGDALKLLIYNRIEASLQVCVVKPSGFGEARIKNLEDIAVHTGGQVVSEAKGGALGRLTQAMIGEANRVIVTANDTTIVGGGGNEEVVSQRIEQIKAEIKAAENDYEREKSEKRLAKLTGSIGVIYVGASSMIEAKEIKDRVIDATSATRAALEEGVVPGGGAALVHAAKGERPQGANESEDLGIKAVYEAVTVPLVQIVNNADGEGQVILERVFKEDNPLFGYDAKSEEYVPDMMVTGIIDPKKVTRIALENAASVASMVLTTNVTIVEDSKPDPTKGLPNF